jgi:hypothetical protein
MTTPRRQRVAECEERLTASLCSLEGQWVAVRHYEVLDRAGSLEELLERVDVDAVDRIFEVKLRNGERVRRRPAAPALRRL